MNEGDGPLPVKAFGAFPSPSCSPVTLKKGLREMRDTESGPLPVKAFGAFPHPSCSLVTIGYDVMKEKFSMATENTEVTKKEGRNALQPSVFSVISVAEYEGRGTRVERIISVCFRVFPWPTGFYRVRRRLKTFDSELLLSVFICVYLWLISVLASEMECT